VVDLSDVNNNRDLHGFVHGAIWKAGEDMLETEYKDGTLERENVNDKRRTVTSHSMLCSSVVPS
jgi:hypothetical protein